MFMIGERRSLRLWIFLNLTVLLIIPSALAAEGDYVEDTPTGRIYWSRSLVVAEGKGVASPNTVNLELSKAMAEKAAIKDARINLFNTVRSVRLDAANTVGTFMVQNDKYKDEITALVQKAAPLEIKYKSDSTVQVWVGVKLYGLMADFYFQQAAAARPPKTEAKKIEPPQAASSFTISGVIIDTRGLRIKPVLVPKVYNESGNEIFGVSPKDKEMIFRQGAVVYVKDLAFAKAHPRAGDSPYVVKAVKASGPEKVDLVISNTDAQTLLSASETQPFLAQGRLIILLD